MIADPLPVALALAAVAAVLALLHPGRPARRYPDDVEPPAVVGSRRPRRPVGALPLPGRSWRLPGRSRRLPGRSSSAARPDGRSADLAECCDLLAVAATSGLTVAASIRVVGSVQDGPVGGLLRRVSLDVDDGDRLVDALGRTGTDAADPVRPLITTLIAASVSGAPAGPTLQRLADAERRRARRRVEARVRRLPVLLLLPLVGFVLPAFVVLTVVPVGLAAATGAGLSHPAAPDPLPDRLPPIHEPPDHGG